MRYCLAVLALAPLVVAADPLPQFEAIVKKCQGAFDARGASEIAYVDVTKQWVRRVYSPAAIRYDVLRTESLVSPFSAFLEVTQLIALKSAVDEQAAKVLDVSIDDKPMRQVRRLNFAYREGAWQLVGGSSATDAMRDGMYPAREPLKVSKEQLLRDRGPLSHCMASQ